METVATLLRQAQKRLNEERLVCLKHLLHAFACHTTGTTAQQCAFWLGLPADRPSETAAGILLHAAGYRRYRRRKGKEVLLFPMKNPPNPEEWRPLFRE